MERLFSPWRSQYIATFSDKHSKQNDTCLFCAAARAKKHDARNLVLLRREYCFVMMNLYPYNSGHLLIVPYTHTSEMTGLSKEEYAEIMETTASMTEVLTRTLRPNGFNFGANLGREAGAGIDKHVHFHLVPRWSGDTNFMPTLADTKLISEAIAATYKRIKKNLGKK